MIPPSTHQKILFKYHSPILDEVVCETMWATPVDAAKGIYRLDNIPSYGPLIATDDEFYAVFDESEQWLTYQKTTKTSGNSVVVVMVIHESYDKEVIRDRFLELNCASEGVSANYFSMEILKDTDYYEVREELIEYEAAGILEYAEPCLSEKHRNDLVG